MKKQTQSLIVLAMMLVSQIAIAQCKEDNNVVLTTQQEQVQPTSTCGKARSICFLHLQEFNSCCENLRCYGEGLFGKCVEK